MEIGTQLALSCFWWTWNDASIRKAVEAAHLEHWASVVEKDFAINKEARHGPRNWDELLLLGRERQNVVRVAKGQSSSTKQFLLGIASILQRDMESLYPATADWIASAALYVSACGGEGSVRAVMTRDQWRKALQFGVGFTRAQATGYTEFMLKTPPETEQVGAQAVERRLLGVPRLVAENAVCVATCLGPILVPIDDRLNFNRK